MELVQSAEPILAKPSLIQRFRDSLRRGLGRPANWIGLPGVVAPTTIDDAFAGKVEIRTSPYFTVISINGRDLYFRRWSGKFDGTGMCIGCSK